MYVVKQHIWDFVPYCFHFLILELLLQLTLFHTYASSFIEFLEVESLILEVES